MDFEDSGIDSDPKINNETDTLKQKNEPIISFSPQRCRFDSVPSGSRKSSASYSISVADLQLDDPLVNFSSSPGQQNTQQPISSTNNENSNSLKSLINLSTHNNASSSSSSSKRMPIHQVGQQQQSHFANVQNHISQNQSQAPPQQPYPFLYTQSLSSSTSAALAQSTINTLSSSTLNSTSSALASQPLPATTTKSLNTAPYFPPTNNSLASSTDNNSISLMVNGAVLSTNNNSTASTVLDLQKRLERRIAQASAAAASSPSNSSITKTHDSILSEIIAATTTPASSTITSNNNASNEHVGNNGNQICFSPQKSSSSNNPQKMLGSLPPSLWESDPSTSEIEDLLWESKIASETEGSSSKVLKKLVDDSSSNVDNGKMDVEQSNEESKSTSEPDFGGQFIDKAHGTTSNNTSGVDIATNPASNNSTCKANKCGVSNKNNVSKSGQNTRNGSSSSNNNTHATHGTTQSASAASSSSSTSVIVVNSGFDIRKVSALLPPQRLAIPSKQSSSQVAFSRSSSGKSTDDNGVATTATFPPPSCNSSSTTTTAGIHRTSTRSASVSETCCNDGDATGSSSLLKGNGNVKAGSNSSKLSSEKKPLVQWDSDESEEELSFFPPSKRGVITDNLSIDNMSLSGEEEDLHLTPPRPLTRKCPCDPRTWLERNDITSSQHHHSDSTRSITSRPCVIT